MGTISGCLLLILVVIGFFFKIKKETITVNENDFELLEYDNKTGNYSNNTK